MLGSFLFIAIFAFAWFWRVANAPRVLFVCVFCFWYIFDVPVLMFSSGWPNSSGRCSVLVTRRHSNSYSASLKLYFWLRLYAGSCNMAVSRTIFTILCEHKNRRTLNVLTLKCSSSSCSLTSPRICSCAIVIGRTAKNSLSTLNCITFKHCLVHWASLCAYVESLSVM